jgi:HEPN domain-containing protein
MLKAQRYVYVVFMCHLAIEKALKALVAETQPGVPPRTHDLQSLLRRLDLGLSTTHLDFVSAINQASVPTRYPEDLAAMIRLYPRRVANAYLAKTKRLLKWLRRDPRLGKS